MIRLVVETRLIRDGDLPALRAPTASRRKCIEQSDERKGEEERDYGQCSAMRLARFLRSAISRLKIGLRYHACRSFFSCRGTEKGREREEGRRGLTAGFSIRLSDN